MYTCSPGSYAPPLALHHSPLVGRAPLFEKRIKISFDLLSFDSHEIDDESNSCDEYIDEEENQNCHDYSTYLFELVLLVDFHRGCA